LLIKRRSYPFGYTFPGGHLEYNEDPWHALKREIFEETGLKVEKAKLIFNDKLDITKCRYGADSHIWYLYQCWCPDQRIILNPESEEIETFSLEETLKLDLTPPARYLLEHVELEPV